MSLYAFTLSVQLLLTLWGLCCSRCTGGLCLPRLPCLYGAPGVVWTLFSQSDSHTYVVMDYYSAICGEISTPSVPAGWQWALNFTQTVILLSGPFLLCSSIPLSPPTPTPRNPSSAYHPRPLAQCVPYSPHLSENVCVIMHLRNQSDTECCFSYIYWNIQCPCPNQNDGSESWHVFWSQFPSDMHPGRQPSWLMFGGLSHPHTRPGLCFLLASTWPWPGCYSTWEWNAN